MSNTWKIYILAIVSFLVGTSEYIISGILDQIAHTLGITLAAAPAYYHFLTCICSFYTHTYGVDSKYG